MSKVAEEIGQLPPPSAVASVVAASRDADSTAPADSTARTDTSSILIREVAGPDRNSLVGALASAIVHMSLLIGLGLLFSTVQKDSALEIQLAVANTNANESIETFSVEVEQAVDQPSDSNELPTAKTHVELKIDEPTLVLDLAATAPSESFDGMEKLSDAIEPPGGKQSGKESNKKGSFFGADAYGDEFVYVVDMSTSMGYRSEYGQTRFKVACRELLRSIKELKPNQKFCVVMFCYRTRVMFDLPARMLNATTKNKQRLAYWVNGLKLGGGTDPRYGTMIALNLKPDAIFLLSDGEFNGQNVNTHGIRGNVSIERLIQQNRKDAVPIHTIAFEDTLNRQRLRRIASATHGTHRFVGNVSDQELLLMDLASKNSSDAAYGMQCLIDGTHQIRDDRHLRMAANVIARRFTSSQAKLREKAHQAMLVIADGTDVGPIQENPTKEDFAAARKEWLEYWSEYFREKRMRDNEFAEDTAFAVSLKLTDDE